MLRYIILTATFLIVFVNCLFSQQLVNTVNDLYKLNENKQNFMNKPLNELLKEIKPAIKMVYGQSEENTNLKHGYIRFKFVTRNEDQSLKREGKMPPTLLVYVKERFTWDLQTRQNGKEFLWTNEDLVKYGNLTVIDIRVYGDGSKK